MYEKKKDNSLIYKYLQIFAAVVIGFAIGAAIKPQPKQLILATSAEKENAKKFISSMYLTNNGTINCTDPSDPINPRDRTIIFNKYLQVNGYANRAVVRGCNDTDQLLAKTKQGYWVITDVNINLDARVNPIWQKECLIQDITVTDTKFRPENASIDSRNIEVCKRLDQKLSNYKILSL